MSKEYKYPPEAFKKNLEFVRDQDIIKIATDPEKTYSIPEMRQIVAEYKKKEG